MKKKHGYLSGVLMIVGGGVMTKFVDASAGAALVAAGAFVLGAIQKEWFVKPATLGKVPPEKQASETD
jgi:acyl-CoA hydrolase